MNASTDYIHWEYTRSQHDLQLTEVNKVTCMPHWRCELANCPGVLMLHWAFLPLKMVAQYLSTFLSCAVLHKVCTWNVGVRGSHICEFGPVYSFHLTLSDVTWPRRGTYLGWSWPCSQAAIKSGSGLGMRLGTFQQMPIQWFWRIKLWIWFCRLTLPIQN